jgi:hypothetical protein
MTEITLNEREEAIAKRAAKLAIEEMSGEFYKKVGKTVVEKLLIWVGILAVGFVAGKGWVVKIEYAKHKQKATQFHGCGGQ